MEYFIVILILLIVAIYIRHITYSRNTEEYQLKVYSREFTLTKTHPKYEGENVEFISIGKDGTATIKTLFSGDVIKAKENEFFIGNDYGSHGLRLISVSYDKQEMLLRRYMPEEINTE